jgi:protein-tyrosine-phosphatase
MLNVIAKDLSGRRKLALGMFALGVGYFLWYTPYSALAKSISGGMLPGMHHHAIGGLVLLPAHAIGQLLVMPLFVWWSGWWRYSGRRQIAGRNMLFPSRHTAESAFWMAIIVGTTTLNFTFPGASIVFMLVLMRIGTLLIGPAVDLLRRRKIHWYSFAALVLCLVSAAIALGDISNYKLTFGAVLSLVAYCVAYYLRFRVMSAQAKTGDLDLDRRYFIEEHMTTPILLLLMVGIPAVINVGPWMGSLHVGFTTFLGTSTVIPALLIGVCYEGLFIMTSLIFLDRREFTFNMPVHVCASLLAGVVASLALSGIFNAPQPSSAQYVAAAIVIAGAFMLSYPTVRAYLERRSGKAVVAERLVLFVCSGNTARSPMAAAIARAELANGNGNGSGNGTVRWLVDSAGVSVGTPGASLAPEALTALGELGVNPPQDHKSRQLTPAMCVDTEVVYCMTHEQRDKIISMAPGAAERTMCLDPDADVPDPSGQPAQAYSECATQLQTLIRRRLQEQRERYAATLSTAETA